MTPTIVSTQNPPHTILGILSRLGPGMIIAGSIVGSGELIGTTKTGAEAGFWLLWLFIAGCVVKVFAQVEFGRFAIVEGRSSMEGMNAVPGPRLRVNWLMWYWTVMFALGLGQLGGIVGSVGQAMAMSFPITGDVNRRVDVLAQQSAFDRAAKSASSDANALHDAGARSNSAAGAGHERPAMPRDLMYTYDDVIWAGVITAITSVLLVVGRYALVQNVSTALVAGFTAVTVITVCALATRPEWAITASDLITGLSFRLPPPREGLSPVTTAMSSFGIIGVGASELIAYPYWCLEKGYARFTGPWEEGTAWAERARGWLRVMQWDAWCSMLVYTFATVAFYLLGAAVLHRAGLVPTDEVLIPTLTEMYIPVFGRWAAPVFLFGAFAVLYSTFFVASAGNARMFADALAVFRFIENDESKKRGWVQVFCGLFPFVSLGIYLASKNPVSLVLASGMAQSVMLPMLGGAAIWFRFRRCDARLAPGRAWDVLLIFSVLALLAAGICGLVISWNKLSALLR